MTRFSLGLGLSILLSTSAFAGEEPSASIEHTPVMRFQETAVLDDWWIVNDGVMGGKSLGFLDIKQEGHGRFHGFVSLENNGGFTSIRSATRRGRVHDGSGQHGVALRVRGDGKIYAVNLRTQGVWQGITYRARVTPPPGEWATMTIPFGEFEPTWRGDRVPGAPPLDPARIRSFGLQISDKQTGDFQLDVDWMGFYREVEPAPPTPEQGV